MTTQELNRDIKRLAKDIFAHSQLVDKSGNNDAYFTFLDTKAKKEFERLFHADREFTAMNRNSILIMLRLNIRHRFVAFHTFGLNIEIDKLI